MTRTREDFCRRLLDGSPQEALDPERLAARFVRYFDVPARPTMDELRSLLKRTGFGEVSGRHLDVKGIHYSAPGGGYDIHYREDMWAGTQDYSVVHATYGIIHETLCDMESGFPPERAVCTQAEVFALFAETTGPDVISLQREYGCSYASVTLRLAEVMREQHFLVSCMSAGGGKALTPGLRPPLRTSGLRWWRGHRASGSGMPRPVRIEGQDAAQGKAVVARPVFWYGRMAKIIVVAVPHRDRAVLSPHLADPSLDRLAMAATS